MASSSSIRAQLTLLVVGLAVPLAALTGFTVVSESHSAMGTAEEESARIAEVTAAGAKQFLDNSQRIARRLSAQPDFRSLDPARCLQSARAVSAALPQFRNVVVADGSGRLVCSALETPAGLPSGRDRPWIRAALETGRFVVGPPVKGRISHAWVAVLTQPIRSATGAVVGTLGLPVDLDRFQAFVSSVEPPERSLVTIADDERRVIARSMNGPAWIGRTLPRSPEGAERVEQAAAGLNRAKDGSGIDRLWAFHRVGDYPWVVWVGTPMQVIYAQVWHKLVSTLALAALALVFIGLGVAYLYRSINGSLGRLIDELDRTEGAPDASVSEGGPGEISAVARAFNRVLTARHKAESDALEAAERHRLVLQATNDAVWDWDLATDHISVNRRFVELFGGSRETGGGGVTFWKRCVHPDDFDRVHDHTWSEIEAGVDTWSQEYRMRTVDGGWAYVLDRGYVLRDEEGAPIRLTGAMMDVTAERRGRDAIRQAKERYRSIMQNAVFGIYVAAPDGRVLDANPALAHTLGVEYPVELIGRDETTFFAHPEELVRQSEQALQENLAEPIEVEWQGADGRPHTVRLYRSTFRDEEGNIAFEVLVEDLTERKDLEAQFRQAQKLEAIGRLAGGVAHDFNNRLTVIRGQSQFILEDLPDDHELRPSVEAILESAERAAGLTAQLLAFSRKQVMQPRVLDLNDVVERLMPMFRSLIGEDIHLGARLHEPLDRVLVDPGQVEQILFNLVVNARDALPRGGDIIIETDHCTLSQEDARSQVGLPPGSYVALRVRDTGVGMSEKVKARAFDPFFTTKPEGVGTGLGLATVYGLTSQNGGRVRIESEEGAGTTIEILLPRTEAAPRMMSGKLEAGLAAAGSGTILVAEDEDAVRDIICRTLRRAGYEVLEAASGGEAMTRYAACAGRIDLLLTDVVMPGLRGNELAAELGGQDPALPVLFMSGYTEEDPVPADRRDRLRRFIRKPFSPHVLLRHIHEMLDEKGAAVTTGPSHPLRPDPRGG